MDENVDVRSLPIVMEQYEELNYEIHMTDSKTKNCLICFSGHGLYFPNTLETFENRIIDNNRFEWKKVNQNKIVEKSSKRLYMFVIYGKHGTYTESIVRFLIQKNCFIFCKMKHRDMTYILSETLQEDMPQYSMDVC